MLERFDAYLMPPRALLRGRLGSCRLNRVEQRRRAVSCLMYVYFVVRLGSKPFDGRMVATAVPTAAVRA